MSKRVRTLYCNFRRRPIPAAITRSFASAAAAYALLPGLAAANPTGGAVVSGSATINHPSATGTVIDQASKSAIINWQQFNIAGNEYVQFVQPSSSSVVLNRIVGGSPSEIFGSLSANGRVFLVNPSGIMFAPGAQLDVGGLVASTLNIKDSDFMAGHYVFASAGGPGATVSNAGTIKAADGGFVVLAGDYVHNSGVVQARLGQVVLASGSQVTMGLDDSGLVSVAVDQATLAQKAGVDNAGQLLADGGRVVMTASTARQLVSSAVNNSGLVRAAGIADHNGEIELTARGGDISNSGTLDASNAAGAGGAIGVHGDGNIDIGSGAQVLASGTTAGGSVHIVADGNLNTRAGSSIVATGAAGHGGQAELSGHRRLTMRGAVSLGQGGTLTLDPKTITIAAGGGNSGSANSNETVYQNFIQGQLQKGTNVNLVATDSITLADLGTGGALDGHNATNKGGSLLLGIGSINPASKSYVEGAGGTISFLNTANSILVDGTLTLDAGAAAGNVNAGNVTGSAVHINGADGITVGNVTASHGSLTLHTTQGNISGGDLTDLKGNIVVGGNGNISLGSVSAAGSSIRLFDAGGNLTAGNISKPGLGIVNLNVTGGGDIAIGTITTDGGISAATGGAGSIKLGAISGASSHTAPMELGVTSGGTLTIGGTSIKAGRVDLTVGSGDFIFDGGNGSVIATNGGVRINVSKGNLSLGSVSVSGTTGGVLLAVGTGNLTAGNISVNTNRGGITLGDSTGSITVGNLLDQVSGATTANTEISVGAGTSLNTGTVTVQAKTTSTINPGSAIASIYLQAGTAGNGDITTGALSSKAIGVHPSSIATSSIDVIDNNGNINVQGGITGGGGPLVFSNSIIVQAKNGDITIGAISAADGAMVLNAGGWIDTGDINGGLISLQSAGAVAIGSHSYGIRTGNLSANRNFNSPYSISVDAATGDVQLGSLTVNNSQIAYGGAIAYVNAAAGGVDITGPVSITSASDQSQVSIYAASNIQLHSSLKLSGGGGSGSLHAGGGSNMAAATLSAGGDVNVAGTITVAATAFHRSGTGDGSSSAVNRGDATLDVSGANVNLNGISVQGVGDALLSVGAAKAITVTGTTSVTATAASSFHAYHGGNSSSYSQTGGYASANFNNSYSRGGSVQLGAVDVSAPGTAWLGVYATDSIKLAGAVNVTATRSTQTSFSRYTTSGSTGPVVNTYRRIDDGGSANLRLDAYNGSSGGKPDTSTVVTQDLAASGPNAAINVSGGSLSVGRVTATAGHGGSSDGGSGAYYRSSTQAGTAPAVLTVESDFGGAQASLIADGAPAAGVTGIRSGAITITGPGAVLQLQSDNNIQVGAASSAAGITVTGLGYYIHGNAKELPAFSQAQADQPRRFSPSYGGSNVFAPPVLVNGSTTWGAAQLKIGGIGQGSSAAAGKVAVFGDVAVSGVGAAQLKISASSLKVGTVGVTAQAGSLHGTANSTIWTGSTSYGSNGYYVTRTYSDGSGGAATFGKAAAKFNLGSGDALLSSLTVQGASDAETAFSGGHDITVSGNILVANNLAGAANVYDEAVTFTPYGSTPPPALADADTRIVGGKAVFGVGFLGDSSAIAPTGTFSAAGIEVDGFGFVGAAVYANQVSAGTVSLNQAAGSFYTSDPTRVPAASLPVSIPDPGAALLLQATNGATPAQASSITIKAAGPLTLGVDAALGGDFSATAESLNASLSGALLAENPPLDNPPPSSFATGTLPPDLATSGLVLSGGNVSLDFGGASSLPALQIAASGAVSIDGGLGGGASQLTVSAPVSLTGATVALNNLDLAALGSHGAITIGATSTGGAATAIDIGNSYLDTAGPIKLTSASGITVASTSLWSSGSLSMAANGGSLSVTDASLLAPGISLTAAGDLGVSGTLLAANAYRSGGSSSIQGTTSLELESTAGSVSVDSSGLYGATVSLTAGKQLNVSNSAIAGGTSFTAESGQGHIQGAQSITLSTTSGAGSISASSLLADSVKLTTGGGLTVSNAQIAGGTTTAAGASSPVPASSISLSAGGTLTLSNALLLASSIGVGGAAGASIQQSTLDSGAGGSITVGSTLGGVTIGHSGLHGADLSISGHNGASIDAASILNFGSSIDIAGGVGATVIGGALSTPGTLTVSGGTVTASDLSGATVAVTGTAGNLNLGKVTATNGSIDIVDAAGKVKTSDLSATSIGSGSAVIAGVTVTAGGGVDVGTVSTYAQNGSTGAGASTAGDIKLTANSAGLGGNLVVHGDVLSTAYGQSVGSVSAVIDLANSGGNISAGKVVTTAAYGTQVRRRITINASGAGSFGALQGSFVNVSADHGISTGTVTADSGSISLTANHGNIATANLSAFAAGSADAIDGSITVKAGGGINVGSISAYTQNHGTVAGDLTIGGVSLTANSAGLGGALVVNGAISTTAYGGSVGSVDASVNIVNSGGKVSTGDITTVAAYGRLDRAITVDASGAGSFGNLHGSQVTVSARGGISAGTVTADSGSIGLTAAAGNIKTTDLSATALGSADAVQGSISVSAGGSVNVGNVSASAHNGSSAAGARAIGFVDLSANTASLGGGLIAGTISSSATGRSGGSESAAVTLLNTGGKIQAGGISTTTSGEFLVDDITVTASGTVQLGDLAGRVVSVTGDRGITTGNVSAAESIGLAAKNGNIKAGNLGTSALGSGDAVVGDITVSAGGGINVGNVSATAVNSGIAAADRVYARVNLTANTAGLGGDLVAGTIATSATAGGGGSAGAAVQLTNDGGAVQAGDIHTTTSGQLLQDDIAVSGFSAVQLGNLSGSRVNVTSTDSSITVGNVSASATTSDPVMLQAADGLTGGNITANGMNVVAIDGNITLGNLQIGTGDFTLLSSTSAAGAFQTVGNVSYAGPGLAFAATDNDFTFNFGNINVASLWMSFSGNEAVHLGNVTSPGNVTLATDTGDLTFGNVSAANIDISTNRDLSFSGLTLNASGTLGLNVTGTLGVTNSSLLGQNVSVSGSTGLNLGGVTVSGHSGAAASVSLSSSGDISLANTSVEASGSETVDAGGTLSLTNTTLDPATLMLTAADGISLSGSTLDGGAITLDATAGAVGISSSSLSGSSLTIDAAGNITTSADSQLQSTSFVDLVSSGGQVSVGGKLSGTGMVSVSGSSVSTQGVSGSSIDLTATTGSLVTGNLSANSAIDLSGPSVSAGDLSGTTVKVNATAGDINVGSVTATTAASAGAIPPAYLTATGNVTAKDINAYGMYVFAQAGNVTLRNLNIGKGQLTMLSSNSSAAANITTGNITYASAGGLTFFSTGTFAFNFGQVNAASLSMNVPGATVDIAGVNTTGNVDISTGSAKLSVGPIVSSGGSVDLVTGNGILSAGDISAKAISLQTGGALGLGATTLDASGILSVTAGGALSASGTTFQGQTVDLSGGSVALSQGSSVAGGSVLLDATAGTVGISASSLSGSGLTIDATGGINTSADSQLLSTSFVNLASTGGPVSLGADLSAPGAVTIAGGSVSTQGVSGASIGISAGAGNIDTGALSSGGNVTVTATAGTVTLGGTLTLGTGGLGALQLQGTGVTTQDIVDNSPLVVNGIGNDLTITATAGSVQTGNITALGPSTEYLKLAATGGGISTGKLTVEGVTATAPGNIALGALDLQSLTPAGVVSSITSSGGNVSLNGPVSSNAGFSASAGGTLTTAAIDVSGTLSLGGTAVDSQGNALAGGKVTVSSTTGALSVGDISSPGDIALTTTTGALGFGNLSGNSITLTSGHDLSFAGETLAAGGTLSLAITGQLAAGDGGSTTGLYGKSVSLSGSAGLQLNHVAIGGSTDGAPAQSVSLSSTGGGVGVAASSLSGATLSVSGHTGASIDAASTLGFSSSIDIAGGLGTTAVHAALSTPGALTLTGASVSAGDLSGATVSVTATSGSITVGNVSASANTSDPVMLQAANGLSGGNITANGMYVLATDGNITLGNLQIGTGDFTLLSSTSAAGAFQTVGNINYAGPKGLTFAATDNDFTFNFGNINVASLSMSFSGNETVHIGNVTSPGNVTLATDTGDLSFGNISGANVDISTNHDLSFSGLTLDASGTLGLNITGTLGVTSSSLLGQNVSVSGSTGLNLTGATVAGHSGAAASISLASSGGTINLGNTRLAGASDSISGDSGVNLGGSRVQGAGNALADSVTINAAHGALALTSSSVAAAGIAVSAANGITLTSSTLTNSALGSSARGAGARAVRANAVTPGISLSSSGDITLSGATVDGTLVTLDGNNIHFADGSTLSGNTAVVLTALGTLDAGGGASTLNAGALSAKANVINLSDAVLVIGTGSADFGSDPGLLQKLAAKAPALLPIGGVNASPNAAFAAPGGVTLGQISLAGGYLFVQAPTLLLPSPTGAANIFVDFLPTDPTVVLNLGLLSPPAGVTTLVFGGTPQTGNIVIGDGKSTIQLTGNTNLVFASGGTTYYPDAISSSGQVVVLGAEILQNPNTPEPNLNDVPLTQTDYKQPPQGVMGYPADPGNVNSDGVNDANRGFIDLQTSQQNGLSCGIGGT